MKTLTIIETAEELLDFAKSDLNSEATLVFESGFKYVRLAGDPQFQLEGVQVNEIINALAGKANLKCSIR